MMINITANTDIASIYVKPPARGRIKKQELWLRAFNRIFMEKVQQHRQIYPLPFEQICKLSSFEQILGRKKSDYTEDERKARWNKAMDIQGGKRVKEYYSNLFECIDCKHFQNGWCGYASLPCGVNPILTYQDGSLGMACQGVGHELIEGSQMQIEFNDSDLPF